MCPHLLLVWCFVAMGGPFALCRHLHYLFHVFKISLDHARTSFYRSANAIFGKVGRVANDYGNATLAGLPDNQLSRLQSVLNAAARLVFSTRKHEPVSPMLRDLHSCRSGSSSSQRCSHTVVCIRWSAIPPR